jgi:Arc/MetJ-type ribon-helix-helix transcriptional regulator
MREASISRSIRMPVTVDAMLDDLVQEGVFPNRTEAILEGVRRLHGDYARTESDVAIRLSLPVGDYNNLKRLAQLQGGTEEHWAQRLIERFALEQAREIAKETSEWDEVFRRKRSLEERTEGVAGLTRR